jgi:hypothetical protein
MPKPSPISQPGGGFFVARNACAFDGVRYDCELGLVQLRGILGEGAMEKKSAQIATVCECIDNCFAFALWCDDFAQYVDPEDMMGGLDRGFEVVSDATRLHSFVALRKLDDFLSDVKSKPTDLVVSTLGINKTSVLDAGETFLTPEERTDINTGVAHLTERLALEDESEVGLQAILKRSMPIFSRLVSELRKADTSKEASQWLDKTDALIKRENEKEAASLTASE